MHEHCAEAHGFEAEWSDYAKVAGLADEIIDLHCHVSEASRTRAEGVKELEQMQRIGGPGDVLEALRTTLAATDIQTVHDGVREFEMDLEEVDARRSELDTERGSIRTTLN